ncbi:MAG: hypothetical protein ACRD3N_15400 [Terracidiphilus sp.]
MGGDVSVCVTVSVSRFTKIKPLHELRGITYFTQQQPRLPIPRTAWALAIAVLAACAALNFIFR